MIAMSLLWGAYTKAIINILDTGVPSKQNVSVVQNEFMQITLNDVGPLLWQILAESNLSFIHLLVVGPYKWNHISQTG